jgi:hypothetical protein
MVGIVDAWSGLQDFPKQYPQEKRIRRIISRQQPPLNP